MRYEKHIDLQKVGKIAMHHRDFKSRLIQAKKYIKEAFSLCKNPYVALSGGKDSIAMLGIVNDVAMELNREFVCWLHYSDASFPSTLEICHDVCKKMNRQLIVDESPVSAFDVIGKQSDTKFGKKGYFFDAVERMAGQYDLVFVGVRAFESARRMHACRVHGHLFDTNVAGKIKKCHPIQWFKIENVAAALAYYDLPIHPIYSKMNLGDAPIRLGYATSLDLIEMGTVVFLKRNYPDIFKKLENKLPEIRQYI